MKRADQTIGPLQNEKIIVSIHVPEARLQKHIKQLPSAPSARDWGCRGVFSWDRASR